MTQHDANPWSAVSALMSLHNGNDRHTPTNGIIARPANGDVKPEAVQRPTLSTPTSDTQATATQVSNNTVPIVNVFAGGDVDLLPPRFSSDSNLDADDWITDFHAYIRVRKIPLDDAVEVFRARISGTARQWIETIPSSLTLEEHITNFRERFSTSNNSNRPAVMSEL